MTIKSLRKHMKIQADNCDRAERNSRLPADKDYWRGAAHALRTAIWLAGKVK